MIDLIEQTTGAIDRLLLKTDYKNQDEVSRDLLAIKANFMYLCRIINIKEKEIEQIKLEKDKFDVIAANLQISRQKAYDYIEALEKQVNMMDNEMQRMQCCGNC